MKRAAIFSRAHTRVIRLGSTALAAAALSACVSPVLDMRPAAEFFDKAPVQNRPVTRPVRAVTSFSESLACMDRMLRDLKVGTTLITSKNIADPSSRASVAAKEMVITTLSQMSRVSNAFRYVDYEVDIVRQDTVQNLTGLLLNANQIQLQRPALYISGAIAYVDQGILRNGEQAGTSATRLELGYAADWNATLIGLEMHLGDFRTRTLVPGIDSANDIIFGSRGQGLDAAARISRYGVQFNMSRATTMGAGAAVRTLIELGLIEIIGKWARVPYWQCLMIERTNPQFERQFRDWFDALNATEPGAPLGVSSPDKRSSYAKKALAAAGYFNGEFDDSWTPIFRKSLARYQSDHGLIPSGDLTFDTFQKLFQGYVEIDDHGMLQRVGWDSLETASPKLGLTVEIANQKFIPGVFDAGERIYMNATVSRESYLYCFYQDVKGRVSRLFPNPFQRDTAIPANRILRIPDWLVLNPGFTLRAGDPGREKTRCYASETDIWDRVPEILRGTAILPMVGVESLDAVDKALRMAVSGTNLAVSEVSWTIKKPAVQVSKRTQNQRTQVVKNAGGVVQANATSDNQAQVVKVRRAPSTNDLGAQRSRLKFPEAPGGFYRIREGDTLSSIALGTGLAMHELQAINGLINPDRILTGKLLRIINATPRPKRQPPRTTAVAPERGEQRRAAPRIL